MNVSCQPMLIKWQNCGKWNNKVKFCKKNEIKLKLIELLSALQHTRHTCITGTTFWDFEITLN